MMSKKLLLVGIILILFAFSSISALAEDVTFNLNVPNEKNIKPGDEFEVQVYLDIAANKGIKSAEFVLTPSTKSVSFVEKSAVSGNLFSGATNLYLTSIKNGGYQFGETSTGTEVSGNKKLLVTLKAKAVSAGSVTFTFSELKAAKGSFTRTTTSVSKTITINGACTPDCAGKNCGSNGCSGVCGACALGETCTNGLCSKTDACAGITCPDTCQGTTKKIGGACFNGACSYKELPNSPDCGYVVSECQPDPLAVKSSDEKNRSILQQISDILDSDSSTLSKISSIAGALKDYFTPVIN